MKYASEINDVDFIKTGLFIDTVSGGIPRGKIMEVWGDSGVGKSTLVLQAVESAQKQGLKCLWADVEWAFDPKYASRVGVDTKKLGVIQEQYAETVLDEIEAEVPKWDIIVLDSIGALTPRAEIEKGADGKVIGGQAGLVARFCRKVVPLLAMHNTALVVINHSFTDIMSGALKTSGGKKLEYHRSLSLRLKTKFGVSLKKGQEVIGKIIVAEVKRNKLSDTEGKSCEGHMIFGKGFVGGLDLLEAALNKGVITKTGNTYFLGKEKLGMISALRDRLQEDEELREKIKALF